MPALTREELYALVWAEPVRTVAARFGMSDVGFKKHCLRGGVPVPERGYWAKLAAGKKVTPIPLPPRGPGASNVVAIGGETRSWRYDPEAELAEPLPPPPEFREPLEVVKARIQRRTGKVALVRDLSSPWGVIRKLLEEDERRREKQKASSWASSWYDPLFESGFEKRRLKLLNSLAYGLIKAGAKLEIRGKEARELSVKVGSMTVALGLDHPTAKPNRHGEWQTRPGPSDTLRLKIGPEAPAMTGALTIRSVPFIRRIPCRLRASPGFEGADPNSSARNGTESPRA